MHKRNFVLVAAAVIVAGGAIYLNPGQATTHEAETIEPIQPPIPTEVHPSFSPEAIPESWYGPAPLSAPDY